MLSYPATCCRAAPGLAAAPVPAIMMISTLPVVEVLAHMTSQNVKRPQYVEAMAHGGRHALPGHMPVAPGPLHAGVIAATRVPFFLIRPLSVALTVAARAGFSRTNCFSGGASNSRRAKRNPPMMARRSVSSNGTEG